MGSGALRECSTSMPWTGIPVSTYDLVEASRLRLKHKEYQRYPPTPPPPPRPRHLPPLTSRMSPSGRRAV